MDFSWLNYDHLLILVPTFVIGLAIGRSLSKQREIIQQEERRRRNQKASYYNNEYSPTRDFAALIDAISYEGSANRKEEKREDWWGSFREIITIVLIAATLCAFIKQIDEMRKVYIPIKEQAKAIRDQLTLAYPPKIIVTQVHIWPKSDKNWPQNPDNEFPTLKPGEQLEGAAFAVNGGREAAKIVSSYIMVVWAKGLTMNDPAWGKGDIDPNGPHSARPFYWGVRGLPFRPVPTPNNIGPGDSIRWAFETVVPEAPSGDLYVIGSIKTEDRLCTPHGTFFARKYNPSTRRFEAVNDKEYENQD